MDFKFNRQPDIDPPDVARDAHGWLAKEMSRKMTIKRHKKSKKRRAPGGAATGSGWRKSQRPCTRPDGVGASSPSEQPPASVIDVVSPGAAGHSTSAPESAVDPVAAAGATAAQEEPDGPPARGSRPGPCTDPATFPTASVSAGDSETSAGGTPERAPSDAGVIFDDPSHLDVAFFDVAPDLPCGLDPVAPSAHFLPAAAQRRARLAKYVRAAVALSVALCVAALVKAVATRDTDQAPSTRSHPRAISPSLDRALERVSPTGGASLPGRTGRENAGLAGGDRRDSRGIPEPGIESPQ